MCINHNVEISKEFKYKKYFKFHPFYTKGKILKENDRARVARLKDVFEKESKFNWGREIFRIHRVRLTDPIIYVLKDSNDKVLTGIFYREELQKVEKTD